MYGFPNVFVLFKVILSACFYHKKHHVVALLILLSVFHSIHRGEETNVKEEDEFENIKFFTLDDGKWHCTRFFERNATVCSEYPLKDINSYQTKSTTINQSDGHVLILQTQEHRKCDGEYFNAYEAMEGYYEDIIDRNTIVWDGYCHDGTFCTMDPRKTYVTRLPQHQFCRADYCS